MEKKNNKKTNKKRCRCVHLYLYLYRLPNLSLSHRKPNPRASMVSQAHLLHIASEPPPMFPIFSLPIGTLLILRIELLDLFYFIFSFLSWTFLRLCYQLLEFLSLVKQ